jgi:hypothetical protein
MAGKLLEFVARFIVFIATPFLWISSKAVHVAQDPPEPVVRDEVVPALADLTCSGEGAGIVDESEGVESEFCW